MLDLRAYRLGFAPVLAALVVLAFSIRGVPEPLEPAVATIEFDAARAKDAARALARVAPDREPGTEGAGAAADLVRQRFDEIAAGSVGEQSFEASVDGEDVELRNVILTLPGTSDRAIAVIAGRASRTEPGAASSAAATGMLIELAGELGVSDRDRTLIFGSIDGAAAEAEGAREMLDALPDRTVVDAALVITQPGSPELIEPHLVTSSAGRERPSLELVRTAEAALAGSAGLSSELDGALGQIARLAIPAAAGAQAALLDDGVNSIALSSAGEVPLADEGGVEAPDSESLERVGAAALTVIGALDVSGDPQEPATYLRLGDNRIPGWAVALVAATLLVPPALPVAAELARARRDATARAALGWALEWALVGLAPVLALYALALVGLVPSPAVPYDPGAFGVGPLEVIAMLALAGAALGAWWALGLRRRPAAPRAAAAAAGAVCIAACAVAWLANPFLALAMVPLAHVVIVFAAPGRRPAGLAIPAALIAVLPLAAAILHTAGALDWGASSPWQLVVLTAGGGLGFLAAPVLAVAVAAVVAVSRAAVATVGAAPQTAPR